MDSLKKSVLITGAILILLFVAAFMLNKPAQRQLNYRIFVTGYKGMPLDNATVVLYSADDVLGSRTLLGVGHTLNGTLAINGTTRSRNVIAIVSALNYGDRTITLGSNNTAQLECTAVDYVDSTGASGGSNCSIEGGHTRYRLGQLVTEFVVDTPSKDNSTGTLYCGDGTNYTLKPFDIQYNNFLTACGYAKPGTYNASISVNGAHCWRIQRADYPCAN